MFYGYGGVLAIGVWQTIQLALLSLLVSVVIGLAGASAKLSSATGLRAIATAYTTLIRGVPDLVLMLLIFYSIQIGLNHVTDALHWDQIDIDPFVAGVLTIGFIYGAYFTETFRGAFISVPRGQLEAGAAFGMTGGQVFRRVLFPQMMRFALPGLANNWQVILKATALVSIIGLSDIVKAATDAGKGTFNMFYFMIWLAVIYLVLTSLSNLVLNKLNKRYAVGVRGAQL
ncbi:MULTISPECIES: ABC transporter permease [Silvimonas]|uniref:ABC transporter permease n=1 Tax=Silvimonas TaxID=300264 RepID=UPI0027E46BEC|nr:MULTISPECIES: histidine ABC transporter permease HisQ [Silvimonas]